MIEYDTPAGWYGTIDAFLQKPESAVRDDLRAFVSALVLPVGVPQERAWTDSMRLLKPERHVLIDRISIARSWGLILEYALPRERGRRPDLVILTGCSANVIEFKGRKYVDQVDIDQASAYSRDLAEYHAGTRALKVNGVVCIDYTDDEPRVAEQIWLVGGRRLSQCLEHLKDEPSCAAPDIERWVRSDYAPLPSLVRAARQIFAHESLPHIRRASSAGIPQALRSLAAVAKNAEEKSERHIALVTGVPGSGKTLVGLQLVHNSRFTEDRDGRPAVFLSGNGPLVEVLQHALKSKVFVQDVHGFLQRYGGTAKRVPEEHIWVYDKAQRAWDAARVKEKRGYGTSEPEDFVQLGLRTPNWAMLVGLIGEGQEIHLGEEGGLALWSAAVEKSAVKWTIHCPSHIAHHFSGHVVIEDDALNLSTSLRSHLAGDLHDWVRTLLDGKLADARTIAASVRASGYNLYVTRDLQSAKQYVKVRYRECPDARFGLLASSKSRTLPAHGIDASYHATRRFRPGPWYNDPPASPQSCCQLLTVATEFQCQGLELDFPIIGWDTDLLWTGDAWSSSARGKARDPHRLRINSYRVLLTRGRDGMMIFVPRVSALDPTYSALMDAGAVAFKAEIALDC